MWLVKFLIWIGSAIASLKGRIFGDLLHWTKKTSDDGKDQHKKPQFLLEVNDENSWSQALDPDNLVFGQLWLTKELLLRPAKGKQKNEYWDNITDKY